MRVRTVSRLDWSVSSAFPSRAVFRTSANSTPLEWMISSVAPLSLYVRIVFPVAASMAESGALIPSVAKTRSPTATSLRGRFAGPDLSSVGSRRSLEHLRTSILDPNDDVRRRYWVATVTRSGGETATGFVLNEDRHSVQLLLLEGALRSLDKAELETFERDENSLMQSYDGVFDDSELNDLLSYLVSLRPGSSP